MEISDQDDWTGVKRNTQGKQKSIKKYCKIVLSEKEEAPGGEGRRRKCCMPGRAT